MLKCHASSGLCLIRGSTEQARVPCYFHSAHTAAGGARELGCRLPDLFQLIFKRRLEKCGAIVSHPQGFSQPGTPNSTSLLS